MGSHFLQWNEQFPTFVVGDHKRTLGVRARHRGPHKVGRVLPADGQRNRCRRRRSGHAPPFWFLARLMAVAMATPSSAPERSMALAMRLAWLACLLDKSLAWRD